MSHDDFAFEPVPGLPEKLPEGEVILWQGRPDVWALARDALSIRIVAVYFLVLAAWRAIVAGGDAPLAEAISAGSWLLVIGAAACGLLWLTAWAQARAALYTITNRRVAMRVGAALSVTFNLPFRQIETAAMDLRRDGTGTVALTLKGRNTVSYLICWPHVRPWRMSRCEPALRCVPEASKAARILAEAMERELSIPRVARVEPGRAPETAPGYPGAAVPAE